MRSVGFSWMLAVLMAGVGCAGAEDAPVARKVHNPVALVKAGDLDDALLKRLRDWAQNEMALSVPLAESLDVSAATLDQVADEAAKRVGESDLGYVVLFVSTNPVPHHGVYRPDQKVVVVNVNLMREGADDEKFARRLERQVIRGIGVLLGLEWSPNPTSAMASYTTLEELDQIGRNLDPPWQLKMQQRARELGLQVDPDNAYYMLRD
jgi:hypothetical protein